MEEKDVYKTAFKTHQGHFEYKVHAIWSDQRNGHVQQFDEHGIQTTAEKVCTRILRRYPGEQ